MKTRSYDRSAAVWDGSRGGPSDADSHPSRRTGGADISFRTRHESAEVAGSSPARWRMVVVEATEPTYLTRDRSVAQRSARVRHAVSFSSSSSWPQLIARRRRRPTLSPTGVKLRGEYPSRRDLLCSRLLAGRGHGIGVFHFILRIPSESPAPGGGSTPQVRIFDFSARRGPGKQLEGFKRPECRRGARGPSMLYAADIAIGTDAYICTGTGAPPADADNSAFK